MLIIANVPCIEHQIALQFMFSGVAKLWSMSFIVVQPCPTPRTILAPQMKILKMMWPCQTHNGSRKSITRPKHQRPLETKSNLPQLQCQCKSGGALRELAMSVDGKKSSAMANSRVPIAQSIPTVSSRSQPAKGPTRIAYRTTVANPHA